MSTLNNVELLVITVILGLFFITCLVVAVQIARILSKIHRLTEKAESVIDSVESAAEAVKNLSFASKQKFPLMNLIHSLYNMSTKDKSK